MLGYFQKNVKNKIKKSGDKIKEAFVVNSPHRIGKKRGLELLLKEGGFSDWLDRYTKTKKKCKAIAK